METQQCLPFACRVSNGSVQFVFGIYRPRSEMGSKLMGRNLHLRSMNSFHFSMWQILSVLPNIHPPHLPVSNRSFRRASGPSARFSTYQPVFQIDFYHVMKEWTFKWKHFFFFFKVRHAGAVEEEERTLATQSLTQFWPDASSFHI